MTGFPDVDERITVDGGNWSKTYIVTDLETDDGGDTIAFLKDGERGEPGLYRMVREGDDAVIQYHKPTPWKGRFQSEKRTWSSAHRLRGYFAGADDA